MQGEIVSFVSNANQLHSRVFSDQETVPYVEILLLLGGNSQISDSHWKYPTSSKALWSVSSARSEQKQYLNLVGERMCGWLVCGCSDVKKGGAERGTLKPRFSAAKERERKKPLVSSCSANLIKLQLIHCGERFDICLRN